MKFTEEAKILALISRNEKLNGIIRMKAMVELNYLAEHGLLEEKEPKPEFVWRNGAKVKTR